MKPSLRMLVLFPLFLVFESGYGFSQIFVDGFESGHTCAWSSSLPDGCATFDVDVFPAQIDDVLINPGMGFANFHFGWWCNLPPITFPAQECADRVIDHWPENYPDSGTAYFRWLWSDLEPVRGEIDFAMIDQAILSANLLGETFSFRVMTIDEGGIGIPSWLIATPYDVPGQWISADSGSTFWPDYRDGTFLAEHERFITALGARYNNHPAMDHIDIGTVGCWGEWNTACLNGVSGIFEVFDPSTTADYQAILDAYTAQIDHHIDAFPDTPVVMLGLGSGWEMQTMIHAIEGGAGWRVDCWGDWGFWPGFSHMEDLYPDMISEATAQYPAFPDVWKTAPIQLEICGSIPQWEGFGWSADPPDGEVYKTFQWALDQHASVLNAKWTSIPAIYVSSIDDLLKQNGYRFVLDRLNHSSSVTAGESLTFVSFWSNIGVAPSYVRRTLSYRLRSASADVVFDSTADIRTWLPGSWSIRESFVIPIGLSPGVYDIEVVILDRAGTNPDTAALEPLHLGIEGRRGDGWYSISEVTIQ